MALPASGSISFSQISNEFGLPSGRNLGAYRISQNVGTLGNLPLDTGIPTSGTIRFSDFLGKRLNIVVDFYSIQENTTRRNARDRYNNNLANNTVIGGFRTRPSNSSGTKVYINVNRRIGSNTLSRNSVALRTGFWSNNTELIMVIGPNGGLYGAGGNGGNGGSFGANPSRYDPGNKQSETAFDIGNIDAGQGGQGSSALGIDYPTTVINQGVIRAGRGGGGGGGSGAGITHHDIQDCSHRRTSPFVGGGGGAGGSGLPAGTGGQFGDYYSRLSNKGRGDAGVTMPTNGTDGTLTQNGQGGSGGTTTNQDGLKCGNKNATSGAGGAAESNGGNGDDAYTSRGLGGNRGYGVIISSSGSLVSGSISGNASDGDTVNQTVV